MQVKGRIWSKKGKHWDEKKGKEWEYDN